jgi:hypothetical protein
LEEVELGADGLDAEELGVPDGAGAVVEAGAAAEVSVLAVEVFVSAGADSDAGSLLLAA